MNTFKNLVEETIRKYNSNIYKHKLDVIRKCCDDISISSYLMIEVLGCEVRNGKLYIKFGTYYSEIRNSTPIYNAFDKADEILMYTVDKDNPDGAMFVVELGFEDVWKS